jgi:hypothetical protein
LSQFKSKISFYDCLTDLSGSFIFVAGDDRKSQVFNNENSISEWLMASFEQPCESVDIEIEMIIFGSMDGNIAVCSSDLFSSKPPFKMPK